MDMPAANLALVTSPSERLDALATEFRACETACWDSYARACEIAQEARACFGRGEGKAFEMWAKEHIGVERRTLFKMLQLAGSTEALEDVQTFGPEKALLIVQTPAQRIKLRAAAERGASYRDMKSAIPTTKKKHAARAGHRHRGGRRERRFAGDA